MLIVIGLSVFFVLSCSRDAACRVRLLLVCFCSHAFLFSRRLRKERRVFCIHAGAGGVASFATTEGAEVGECVTICVSSCSRDAACRVRLLLVCFCSHAFLFSRRLRKDRRVFVFTLALEGSQASLRQRAQRLVRVGRKGSLEKVLNILSCPLRGAIPIATRGLAGEGYSSPYPLSNRANLLLMVCPGLVATICPFMGLPTRAMSPMMSSSLCLAGSLSHTRGLCCM